MPSEVGGRLPAHASGVGKAMLADSPEPVVQAVLATGLPAVGPRTITAPGLLLRELRRIRELGIAYESEESGHGIGCAASPILGADGTAVAAMSISGWSGKLDLRRIGPAVKTAALAMSRDLAVRGPAARPAWSNPGLTRRVIRGADEQPRQGHRPCPRQTARAEYSAGAGRTEPPAPRIRPCLAARSCRWQISGRVSCASRPCSARTAITRPRRATGSASGAAVVVATCPDVSTVPTLVEPLRSVARHRARRLAEAQTLATVRAGGQVVPLADLGPSFVREPAMFGPDRYHPSAAGYRLAADLVAHSVLSAASVGRVA